MKVFLWVLLALVVLLGLGGCGIWGARGSLIERSQAVDEKWSQVQNVYQRRFDLVPNLVASVDNFMQRQQVTLTEVISMRQRVLELKAQAQGALKQMNPALLDSLSKQLSQQLSSLVNVVVERYPEIQGEALYADLLTQLEGTENRIAQERRLFNETVRAYNAYRQKGFMALMAGSLFNFPYQREFFEASAEAQSAPKVKDLL